MSGTKLHLLVQTFDYSPDYARRTVTTDVHLIVKRTPGFQFASFYSFKSCNEHFILFNDSTRAWDVILTKFRFIYVVCACAPKCPESIC